MFIAVNISVGFPEDPCAMFLSIENISLFAGQWHFLFTIEACCLLMFPVGHERLALSSKLVQSLRASWSRLRFSSVSQLLSGLDVFWFVYVGYVLLNLLDLCYGGFFTSHWEPVTRCVGYSFMLEKVERLQNSIRFCCIMGTWADIAVMNESVVHMNSCFVMCLCFCSG